MTEKGYFCVVWHWNGYYHARYNRKWGEASDIYNNIDKGASRAMIEQKDDYTLCGWFHPNRNKSCIVNYYNGLSGKKIWIAPESVDNLHVYKNSDGTANHSMS